MDVDIDALLDPAWLERVPEEERPTAEKMIAQLREQVENNPLVAWRPLTDPRDGTSPQTKFLQLDRSVKRQLVAGGNRAGKTEIGVVKGLIQAMPAEYLPEHLRQFKHFDGVVKGRIVSPGFVQQAGVIHSKLRRNVNKMALKGGQWTKAYDKRMNILTFVNGSTIDFKTADQDVDQHAGEDLDWIHLDEEPKGERGKLIYQENVIRLLDRGGCLWLTMTPLLGLSWAYEDLYEPAVRREQGYALISMSMDGNATLSSDAKADLLRGFTDRELEARREGKFVHFGGSVYDRLDDARHVVAPPTPAEIKEREVIVGIDPGLTQTGVTWVAYDSREVATVFAELVTSDAPVDVVCDEIRRINKEWQIKAPLFYVIDPSARNRQLTTAESVEGEYIRCGIHTIHGQNAVEAGVMLIRRKLESKTPSLYISQECPTLLWQMRRYRVDDRADGVFAVIKVNDHLCDALRYAMMSRPYDVGQLPETRKRKGWIPDTYDARWESEMLRESAMTGPGGPPMGPMG